MLPTAFDLAVTWVCFLGLFLGLSFSPDCNLNILECLGFEVLIFMSLTPKQSLIRRHRLQPGAAQQGRNHD